MKKFVIAWALLWVTPLLASPTVPFADYVQALKQEAKAQGISASTVDA